MNSAQCNNIEIEIDKITQQMHLGLYQYGLVAYEKIQIKSKCSRYTTQSRTS